MENKRFRSLGSKHNKSGVPSRIRESSKILKGTKNNSIKFRRIEYTVKRGRRFVSETCYRACQQIAGKRRVLLNVLCRPQKIGRLETNSKFEAPKQNVVQEIVQDGNIANSFQGSTARRLASISRLTRCVPPHTNILEGSKVPQVQNSESGLSIQSSAIRPNGSSKNFHKSIGPSGPSGKVRGHPCISVPGRLASKSPVSRRAEHNVESVGGNPNPSRVHHQPEKIPSESNQRPGIHRGQISNGQKSVVITSRKIRKPTRMPFSIQDRGGSHSKTVPKIVGNHGSNDFSSQVLPTPHETHSDVSDGKVEGQLSELRPSDRNKPPSDPTSRMVGRKREPSTGGTLKQTRPSSRGDHRCILPSRLGGLSGGSRSTGEMGFSVETRTHKHVRNGGSIQDMHALCVPSAGKSSQSKVRQLHSSVVHQQGGRNKISVPMYASLEAPEMGSELPNQSRSSSCSGGNEQDSRQVKPSVCQPVRMAVRQASSTARVQYSRSSNDRSVCIREQQADSDILLPVPGTSSFSCRRPSDGLDGFVWVCVPSNILSTISSGEDRKVRLHDHSDSPQVAQEVLVPQNVRSVGRHTSSPSSEIQSTQPEKRQITPSGVRQTRSDGLEIERKRLIAEGFSTDVVHTMQSSIRKSSAGQYDKMWAVFASWCQERGLSPGQAPVNKVLEFLQSLLNKGMAFRSIGVYRSAISYFHDQVDGLPIGQNRQVCKFMKGVFHKNPPVKTLYPTWDLNIVLSFLQDRIFVPLERASVQAISTKTVFLAAITSARRISELQALSRDPPYIRWEKEGVRLRTVAGFLSKTAVPSHLGQEIFLPKMCEKTDSNKELCVYRNVKNYIKVTSSVVEPKNAQNEPRPLFVCYGQKNKGQKASKQTIARWIVHTIKCAYAASGRPIPDHLRAHSTRAQSTSTALFNKVPIEEIMRAADWRTESTFARHYSLDLWKSAEGRVARATLSSKQ